MQCDVCGTEVQPQQKFCMECGARLRHDALPPGNTRDTGETPALPPGGHPMFDPVTGQLIGLPRGPLPPPGAPPSAATPHVADPARAFDIGRTGDIGRTDDIGETGDIDETGESAETSVMRRIAPEDETAFDDDATNVLPAIGQPMTTFAPPDPTPGAGLPWSTYLGPPTPGTEYPAWPGPQVSETEPTRAQYTPAAPPARYDDATGVLPANYAPVRYDPADYDTVTYDDGDYDPWDVDEEVGPLPGQTFRIKPLLVLTLLAIASAGLAMFARVVTIEPDAQPNWKLNDFGTNLTVAGVVIAVTMFGGALAWCTGFRWGAGLAGGAGAGLAGWAAMALGAAETAATSNWPPGVPRNGELTRELGYWGLVGAGGLGLVVLIVSLRRAGNDRRAGLDPWVAALGAIATLAAVLGPLIPLNDADLDLNWASPPGTDWPTAYFVARFAALGLLLVCGVFGFLLVRRYGLGLAIGGTVGIGWLAVTTATEQTDRPIGPAYWNPGSDDGKPYVVTLAGIGLMLFFAIVATAMALIDND